jgi:hypothetical protein
MLDSYLPFRFDFVVFRHGGDDTALHLLKKGRHPCNSVLDLDLVGSGAFLAKSDLGTEK